MIKNNRRSLPQLFPLTHVNEAYCFVAKKNKKLQISAIRTGTFLDFCFSSYTCQWNNGEQWKIKKKKKTYRVNNEVLFKKDNLTDHSALLVKRSFTFKVSIKSHP